MFSEKSVTIPHLRGPRLSNTPSKKRVEPVKGRKSRVNSKVNKFRFYEVDNVLGKRVVDGDTQFLLKWKNYPEDQNSWESVENITPDLVQAYNSDQTLEMVKEWLDDGKEIVLLRDIPKKIVDIRKSIQSGLEFLVRWENEPDKNWIPGQILKQFYPHLVIQFYEEITIIVD